MTDPKTDTPAQGAAYQVLARRLRPQCFSDVIGQDIFVKLIQKAFQKGRLASGFLLTGIRGVGKTTLARLLAKAMNCQNPLQEEGQLEPCGACASCDAFNKEAHTDIVEMDAASNTGVDDMRRVLETCTYAPLQGKYKVFIIDEVHMLSKSAFNALLKTLETPPPHVKFIFATTEVHKIPATIISRCLRFDLKRISRDTLATYLAQVCQDEHVSASQAALNILSDAADGSLRDALSILEKGLLLALDKNQDAPTLDEQIARELLGLKDGALVQEALSASFAQNAKEALTAARKFYDEGGSPLAFLDALADLVHRLTCLKINGGAQTESLDARDQAFLQEEAPQRSLAVLGRLWQMLLKGREELQQAAFPQRSLEMILIRLCYASQLPTPDQLIQMLGNQTEMSPVSVTRPTPVAPQPPPKKDSQEKSLTLACGQDLLTLLQEKKEGLLHSYLLRYAAIASVKDNTISLKLASDTPKDLAINLRTTLEKHVGGVWTVLAEQQENIKTEHQILQEREQEKYATVATLPDVQNVLKHFPGAQISTLSPTSHHTKENTTCNSKT